MATEGGPIGRANIELGAVTTGLEADLAAAKAKTVQSVTETEKAAAAKAAEATVAASQSQATAQRAVEAATQQSEAKAKTFGDSLKGLIAPVRAVTTAFTGLIGIFSTFTAVIGLVIYGFQKITEEARKKREVIDAAKKSFKEYVEQLEKLQKVTLTKNDDPVKDITERYDAQIAKEREVYDELLKQALIRRTNYKEVMSNLINERDQRVADLEKAKQQAIAAEVQLSEFKVKSARDAQEKIAADIRRVNEELRMEERSAMLADIRKIAEAQADAEDYYAQRNRAQMQAQREQFAQLRNDINGLFNTSGLEVGINRVGALIQTLIDKVGDNR